MKFGERGACCFIAGEGGGGGALLLLLPLPLLDADRGNVVAGFKRVCGVS